MSARKRKCPTPNKKAYWTRAAAEAVMRRPWTDSLRAPTRVYWCRGGHFHLTSKVRT